MNGPGQPIGPWQAHDSAALGTRVGGTMPAYGQHRVHGRAALGTRVGGEVLFL